MKKTFFLTITTVLLLALLPFRVGAESEPLNRPADISGTVFFDEDQTPLGGVNAEAYRCDEDQLIAETLSNAKGEYSLANLAPACYQLRFSKEGYESSWHQEEAGPRENAMRLALDGVSLAGFETPLSRAGAIIKGRITTQSGEPLANVWANGVHISEDYIAFSDARTDAEGRYTLEITPGPTFLFFTGADYVPNVHGESLRNPTIIETVAGEVVAPINGTLTLGGIITGQILDEKGQGIAGIMVIGTKEESARKGISDKDGRFEIKGVATGEHRLFFIDTEGRYPPQWHSGQSDPEKATGVKVTAPKKVSGIKEVLRLGGEIRGWVIDSEGNGIADVIVFAQEKEADGFGFGLGAGSQAITDASGEYRLSALPSGDYILSFMPQDKGYLRQMFPGTNDVSDALPVSVTAPQIVEGVNQVLPTAYSLSGTILTPEGQGVPGAFISAYEVNASDENSSDGTISDEEGAYSLAMPPGEYQLHVQHTGAYLEQWSGGSRDKEKAEAVTVSPERPSVLDIVLAPGGSICGKVRDAAGNRLSGVRIAATDVATGKRAATARANEEGEYLVEGLADGSYSLSASGSEIGYIRRTYPREVAVRAPERIDDIDFLLSPGGAISGHIYNQAGTPERGVKIEVYDPATWDEIDSSWSDDEGAYQIGGLANGDYRVRFEKEGYAVQWYRGQSRREDGLAVNINGTATVSGINADLFGGLTLEGVAKDASGSPLYDAEIEVFGEIEDEPFDTVHSATDGHFAFSNLAPGRYRLRCGADGHMPKWFGGAERSSADAITVGEAGFVHPEIALPTVPCRVAGKLLSPQGDDVGQAWVSVLDVTSNRIVADERICECSGKFDIPLPTGAYKLKVERHGLELWYGGSTQENAEILSLNGELTGLEIIIDD